MENDWKIPCDDTKHLATSYRILQDLPGFGWNTAISGDLTRALMQVPQGAPPAPSMPRQTRVQNRKVQKFGGSQSFVDMTIYSQTLVFMYPKCEKRNIPSMPVRTYSTIKHYNPISCGYIYRKPVRRQRTNQLNKLRHREATRAWSALRLASHPRPHRPKMLTNRSKRA